MIPGHCDDHSLSKCGDDTFYIFGGFFKGSRTNDVYKAVKNGTTLNWDKCESKTNSKPCPRASHSQITCGTDSILIFGG